MDSLLQLVLDHINMMTLHDSLLNATARKISHILTTKFTIHQNLRNLKQTVNICVSRILPFFVRDVQFLNVFLNMAHT